MVVGGGWPERAKVPFGAKRKEHAGQAKKENRMH